VAFSREESAVALPAESRFLADKPGFGMTKDGVEMESPFRKLRYE
jgi:hypothetical protein